MLYAAQAGAHTVSDLWTADEATVALTDIGPTGSAFTGLAIDPTDSTVYGVTSQQSQGGSDRSNLYTIDPLTGAATLVGNLHTGSANRVIPDIAFDSSGQLWGYNNSENRICRIDKATAAITNLGSVPVSAGHLNGGYGLTFTSTDVLYWFPDRSWGNFYTVDTTTGVGTLVATMDDSGLTAQGKPIGAATCRLTDDTVFVVSLASGAAILATVNLATGVLTQVGDFGSADWDSLAWAAGGGGGGGGGTAPVFVSAAVNGDTLTVVMDQALQVSPGPDASEFTVTTDSLVIPVDSATVSGSDIILALGLPVGADADVQVSYTP